MNRQNRDTIFSRPNSHGQLFRFDAKVAEVFDDMLLRSIPCYREVNLLILQLIDFTLPSAGRIYDLGCSTGNTLALMAEHLAQKSPSPQLIGIDSSSHMIEKCRQKIDRPNCHFYGQDLLQCKIEKADWVILNYTLQFLSPEKRQALLKKIYRGMNPGGIIFISEKLSSPNPKINTLMEKLHYNFKREQGYSKLEIARKRLALEKVLLPPTCQIPLEELKSAGFAEGEMIFRHTNFASYIGVA